MYNPRLQFAYLAFMNEQKLLTANQAVHLVILRQEHLVRAVFIASGSSPVFQLVGNLTILQRKFSLFHILLLM